jgi:hypothetical protein
MRIKLLKCHGHWSNTKDCEPFLYAPCLSRDSRAAQRIEIPDHVGDSCFGCPSVGQPAESCLDSLNRLIMQSVDEAALASWEMHQCHRGAAYYCSFGSGGVLFGSLRKPLACSNA